MPAKKVNVTDQKTPKEFSGREQELKPHGSVTGAGETSVSHPHAQPGSDPDFGADGADNSLSSGDSEISGGLSQKLDR
jgi:hypothetical protein